MRPDPNAAASALRALIRGLSADQTRLLQQFVAALALLGTSLLRDVLSRLDDETLALAAQHDFLRSEAFEELMVRRYERDLHCFYYHLCRDEHATQDLIQKLYLRIFTGLDESTYDADRPFRPWLMTVAYNSWVDQVRGRRPAPTGDPIERESREADPCLIVESAETEARLLDAIARLLPRYRRILEESMNGLEPDQIADKLGITPAEVSRILFRARRKLEELAGLPRTVRPRKKKRGLTTA